MRWDKAALVVAAQLNGTAVLMGEGDMERSLPLRRHARKSMAAVFISVLLFSAHASVPSEAEVSTLRRLLVDTHLRDWAEGRFERIGIDGDWSFGQLHHPSTPGLLHWRGWTTSEGDSLGLLIVDLDEPDCESFRIGSLMALPEGNANAAEGTAFGQARVDNLPVRQTFLKVALQGQSPLVRLEFLDTGGTVEGRTFVSEMERGHVLRHRMPGKEDLYTTFPLAGFRAAASWMTKICQQHVQTERDNRKAFEP